MTVPTRGLTGTELSIAKAARRLMGLREKTVNPHGKEKPVKVLQLRIGDTWIWRGHRRYVATTPFPVGNGQYTFDTHLGGKGGSVEHHRMSGDELVCVEIGRS